MENVEERKNESGARWGKLHEVSRPTHQYVLGAMALASRDYVAMLVVTQG
jgi:hypothetical protein